MGRATIHATAVLVGAKAVLIRGPSGSGKSSLAAALLAAAGNGSLPFARLVGDDRVLLEAHGGRLLARPATALEGLLEVRGVGIRRLPYEPAACLGLAVSLADPGAARLPEPETAVFEGIRLPELRFPAGIDPLPPLLASFGKILTGN